MLEKVLRRSGAIDLETLCILAGQKVWHIRLTLHFLSDEGNMLDCACLAGITALKHFRRPEVEVVGEDVTIVSFLLLDPDISMYLTTQLSTPQKNVHR